jgi:hypothetical protein
MATVQTFGVDADRILASLPQIVIDSGTGILLTTTRATTLINAEAARVNGLIDGAFGSGTSADIASDATSIEYINAQRLVVAACIPPILRADTRALLEDLSAQLELLMTDPARALGRVTDTSSVSAPRTRFANLSLSTTLTAKRARRQFDGRSNLLGVDEGGFEF